MAIGLARLGPRVGYLSRLGDDSFGRSLLGAMRQEGVSTALVETRRGEAAGGALGGGDAEIGLVEAAVAGMASRSSARVSWSVCRPMASIPRR